jgi:hypothetical protein
MFLTVPIVYEIYHDTWEADEVDISPLHIVTIERDYESELGCIISMVNGTTWYLTITREQLKERIQESLKDNLLQKLYNLSRGGS